MFRAAREAEFSTEGFTVINDPTLIVRDTETEIMVFADQVDRLRHAEVAVFREDWKFSRETALLYRIAESYNIKIKIF